MKIGCFALVEPFSLMERQFQAINEMGIEYADLTDDHNGGFDGATTLEIAGAENVKLSAKRLKEWEGN